MSDVLQVAKCSATYGDLVQSRRRVGSPEARKRDVETGLLRSKRDLLKSKTVLLVLTYRDVAQVQATPTARRTGLVQLTIDVP